jgi:hypothetical protein
MSTADQLDETAPAPSLLDGGTSQFCHTVCGVFPDKALCGLTDANDRWCEVEDCKNGCIVCAELERLDGNCHICGTDCGAEEES